MSKYIADKKFYNNVLKISVPIMVQNGISNFVSLLDNIMIGRVGTEQMSGVSIVNQLIFVFYLCIFGAVSGAGILGAQYYGQKNYDGVKKVLRSKLIISFTAMIIAILIFINLGSFLISLYLHDGSATGNLEATLSYGLEYLGVILIGLPFSTIEFSYSSTLRESGETSLPMKASIAAVFINLVLNYLLIYGKFGFPAMGVVGAAIATNIARFIQATIIVIYSHTHTGKYPFMKGMFRNFRIERSILGKTLGLSMPLIFNETLWAAGMAALTSCYSTRGLSVIAALNIQSVIYNIANIMFIAMGDAIAIIVGQMLGKNEIEEGKDAANKIIVMSIFFAVIGGIFMFLISDIFPGIYKTSDEVKSIARTLIIISGCTMPIGALLHSLYFAIRSGGKTLITVLFDSVYLWVIAFPTAYILSRYTDMPIAPLYLTLQLVDLIKVVIGLIIYRSGIWARNITQY